MKFSFRGCADYIVKRAAATTNLYYRTRYRQDSVPRLRAVHKTDQGWCLSYSSHSAFHDATPYRAYSRAPDLDKYVASNLLPIQPSDAVLYAGGGEGEELDYLLQLKPSTLLVVEMNPKSALRALRIGQISNVNGVDLRLVIAAVGSDNDVVSVDLDAGQTGVPSAKPAAGSTTSLSVPCVTIDHIVLSEGVRPQTLVMNIEGSEVSALQGAQETLRLVNKVAIATHDFRFAEASDTFFLTADQVTNLLIEAGFVVQSQWPSPVGWQQGWVFGHRPMPTGATAGSPQ